MQTKTRAIQSPRFKSDTRWIKGRFIPGVVTLGDPKLKQKSQKVKEINQEIKKMCNKMIIQLRKLNGAGLAAPQVGIPLRIFVVEVRKTDLFPSRPASPLYTMINPKLIKNSKQKQNDWEGCFSVPGLIGLVPRFKTIKMQYTTLDGIQKEEIFEGYLARVIQHEYDHLDGVEYLEKMTDINSLSTVENWKKFYLSK